MPPGLVASLLRDTPLLVARAQVADAVATLLRADLPALPVVDDDGCYAGIFGEREFITALFPGYVGSLKHAGFIPSSVDAAIEKRQSCRIEPVSRHMTTEHVEAGPDVSDVQLAEVFIHHRVLIVPITDEARHVTGIVTRTEFFRALGSRFLGHDPAP